MKKLILMEIKCDGLKNRESIEFVPYFREVSIGTLVEVKKKWWRWKPKARPSGDVPEGFTGKIELRSVNGLPLYESNQSVSNSNSGLRQTAFTSVNRATSNVNLVPRLKFIIE